MAMTFTSLTADKTTAGSIKRWINHAELDAEQVLDEAQALIFQTLRVREMRAEFTAISMSVGDSSKALPSGFLDPLGLFDLTNNWRLTLRSELSLQAKRNYESAVLVTGLPENFAIFDEKLQFEFQYESAATLKLIGFKQPDLLAASTNESNFLTARFPHVLRTACLAMAHDFRNNDQRAQVELTKLGALIAKTNAESDLTYRGLEAEVELR